MAKPTGHELKTQVTDHIHRQGKEYKKEKGINMHREDRDDRDYKKAFYQCFHRVKGICSPGGWIYGSVMHYMHPPE